MARTGRPEVPSGANDVAWRALLDTLLDPVFILVARRDAAGTVADFEYRFVNAAGLRLLGEDAEGILGHGELELHPSRRAPGLLECLRRVYRTGEPERLEISWPEHDGLGGTFDASVAKLRDGLVVNARSVSDEKRVERAIASATRSLRTFVAASGTLVHASDETGLYDDACRVLVEQGGYKFAWIGVPSPEDPAGVVALAYHGEMSRDYFDAIHATSAGLVQGIGPEIGAIRTRVVQLVEDVAALPAADPWRQVALEHGVRAAVAFPLIVGDAVSGAIGILAEQAGAFDPATVQLFQEFTAEINYGIAALGARARNEKNLEQLAATLEAAVGAVAASTEFDPYTAGHQRGVAKIAVTIAKELGLGEDVTKGIEVAAMLHDIGKIVVPAQILSKPAKLTAAEFVLVKEHPQAGVDIIAGIDFPWPVGETIRQHHERLDGSGYPSGLKGEEICLGARVVMVADVLEAMTSPRPYRPAASVAEALAEIDKQSGTQFDPDVAAACVRLYSGMKRRRFDGDPGYWYPTPTAVAF
jgi:putative nucleotidyltransferase with HDIG domain